MMSLLYDAAKLSTKARKGNVFTRYYYRFMFKRVLKKVDTIFESYDSIYNALIDYTDIYNLVRASGKSLGLNYNLKVVEWPNSYDLDQAQHIITLCKIEPLAYTDLTFSDTDKGSIDIHQIGYVMNPNKVCNTNIQYTITDFDNKDSLIARTDPILKDLKSDFKLLLLHVWEEGYNIENK